MFKIRSKQLELIAFFVVFTVFASCGGVVAMTFENEGREVPTPISFINGNQIARDSVLMESIPFELSEANPKQAYLITKGHEGLIFSFKDVSAPINFSLKPEKGDSHRAGFSGATNVVYVKTDPDSQYVFDWSLGFVDSDDTVKRTDLVNSSSGVLEIFSVAR